jgi:hypothetical protein
MGLLADAQLTRAVPTHEVHAARCIEMKLHRTNILHRTPAGHALAAPGRSP